MTLFHLKRMYIIQYNWKMVLIALMIAELLTHETSVNLYETARRCIPEDCHLQA
jgi:hypothetical protein